MQLWLSPENLVLQVARRRFGRRVADCRKSMCAKGSLVDVAMGARVGATETRKEPKSRAAKMEKRWRKDAEG